MAVTIRSLEIRVGEDVYQPVRLASGTDLSDWATWALAAYLYDGDGNIVITCTEAASTIVRTATGSYYLWFKRLYTLALEPKDGYFWQTRRIDTGYNTALAEGPVTVLPYEDP